MWSVVVWVSVSWGVWVCFVGIGVYRLNDGDGDDDFNIVRNEFGNENKKRDVLRHDERAFLVDNHCSGWSKLMLGSGGWVGFVPDGCGVETAKTRSRSSGRPVSMEQFLEPMRRPERTFRLQWGTPRNGSHRRFYGPP